jgi:hypothetical protein
VGLSGRHAELLDEAIAADGRAFRALIEGRADDARAGLAEAAALYRRSWEAAPPRSYGRLAGHLTSAVLAGQGVDAAAYVRDALGHDGDSPTSCYALALAALILGDEAAAGPAAEAMRAGGGAFDRAGDALAALAAGDAERYRAALTAIVEDFAGREAHLTGVPVADTALVLEALAARRGMAVRPRSPLMPPLP